MMHLFPQRMFLMKRSDLTATAQDVVPDWQDDYVPGETDLVKIQVDAPGVRQGEAENDLPYTLAVTGVQSAHYRLWNYPTKNSAPGASDGLESRRTLSIQGPDAVSPPMALWLGICRTVLLVLVGLRAASEVQDTVLVTCTPGSCIPGQYLYAASDGWVPPLLPNSFGRAPDGTFYMLETDPERRVKIHHFNQEGKALVMHLLAEQASRVPWISVDTTGEMYLVIANPDQYVLRLSEGALVEARIGRKGPMDAETVAQATLKDHLYTTIAGVLLDVPGQIRVVHTFPSAGCHYIDIFTRTTMQVISKDVPAPHEYEARIALLKRRKAAVQTYGVENQVDAKLDDDGALWYMTYDEKELTIHKVVFDDAAEALGDSAGQGK